MPKLGTFCHTRRIEAWGTLDASVRNDMQCLGKVEIAP